MSGLDPIQPPDSATDKRATVVVGLTEENHEMKLRNIKDRVRRGEYRVDPHAVAEAMVRRLELQARALRTSAESPTPARPHR